MSVLVLMLCRKETENELIQQLMSFFLPFKLAFESLAVISNALTRLEAGDLGICR